MAPSHASAAVRGRRSVDRGCAGRAIELRNHHSGAPTPFSLAEGNTVGGAKRESSGGPARSENQGMHAHSMRENRESPCFARGPDQAGGPLEEGQGHKLGMNEAGQSHSPVVPAKPANKATGVAAELVEERGLTKGNTDSPARSGHRAGTRVPRGLERVRQVASRDKEVRFTALLHHVTVELLEEGFKALRREAAPGVDGMTWEAYATELEGNLQDLHGRST